MAKGGIKRHIFTLLGLIVSVVPVVMSILCYFPIWRERGATSLLSAFALILIFIAAMPIFKFIKEHFKSPAAYTVWLVIFIIFFLLSKIANEMVTISFVGFVSNLIGAFLFKLAKKDSEKKE